MSYSSQDYGKYDYFDLFLTIICDIRLYAIGIPISSYVSFFGLPVNYKIFVSCSVVEAPEKIGYPFRIYAIIQPRLHISVAVL